MCTCDKVGMLLKKCCMRETCPQKALHKLIMVVEWAHGAASGDMGRVVSSGSAYLGASLYLELEYKLHAILRRVSDLLFDQC